MAAQRAMDAEQERAGGNTPTGHLSTLVTIFRGSQSEALVLKTALESRGLHAFVESQFIKALDPFVTGGNVFEIAVQTPLSEAKAAQEAMRELQQAGAQLDQPETETVTELDLDVIATNDSEILGRRLRWGSILFLGVASPIAIFSPLSPLAGAAAFLVYGLLAINYFRKVRKAGVVPMGHRITVAIFLFVAILYGGCLAFYFYLLARNALGASALARGVAAAQLGLVGLNR